MSLVVNNTRDEKVGPEGKKIGELCPAVDILVTTQQEVNDQGQG